MSYSDKEAAEILKRASEMQARSHGYDATLGPKLELADLQRIGGEAGIEASFVESAAHSLAFDKDSGKGAGSQISFERAIDGEFGDAAWDRAVEAMRRSLGHPGLSSHSATGREWSGGTPGNMAWLTARPEGGRTVLRLTADYGVATGLGWILGPTVGLCAGAIVAKGVSTLGVIGPVAFAAFIAVVATCVALSQWIVRRMFAKERVRLSALIDSLVATGPAPVSSKETAVEPKTVSLNG